jgi:hypothetical protein
MTDAGVHPLLTVCAPSPLSDTLTIADNCLSASVFPLFPSTGIARTRKRPASSQMTTMIEPSGYVRRRPLMHLDLLPRLQCLTLRYRKSRPPVPRIVMVEALPRPFGTPSCGLTKARDPHRVPGVRVIVVLPTGRVDTIGSRNRP